MIIPTTAITIVVNGIPAVGGVTGAGAIVWVGVGVVERTVGVFVVITVVVVLKGTTLV